MAPRPNPAHPVASTNTLSDLRVSVAPSVVPSVQPGTPDAPATRDDRPATPGISPATCDARPAAPDGQPATPEAQPATLDAPPVTLEPLQPEQSLDSDVQMGTPDAQPKTPDTQARSPHADGAECMPSPPSLGESAKATDGFALLEPTANDQGRSPPCAEDLRGEAMRESGGASSTSAIVADHVSESICPPALIGGEPDCDRFKVERGVRDERAGVQSTLEGDAAEEPEEAHSTQEGVADVLEAGAFSANVGDDEALLKEDAEVEEAKTLDGHVQDAGDGPSSGILAEDAVPAPLGVEDQEQLSHLRPSCEEGEVDGTADVNEEEGIIVKHEASKCVSEEGAEPAAEAQDLYVWAQEFFAGLEDTSACMPSPGASDATLVDDVDGKAEDDAAALDRAAQLARELLQEAIANINLRVRDGRAERQMEGARVEGAILVGSDALGVCVRSV